jgi:DNA mismatch endonuclease (patch repair protein)
MTKPDSARSRTMRAVKSKDTKPEIVVRRLLHAMGYRFRLHRRDLPGSPDIVLPKHHAALFVHGCFWHGHNCKRGARMPKSNAEYWKAKIARNVNRDSLSVIELSRIGWRLLVIWECELRARDQAVIRSRLSHFLSQPPIQN